MAEREFLSATEAAELLAVRQSKILAWLRSGELLGADLSERPGQGKARWRIARADLDDFLRSRQPGGQTVSKRQRKPKRSAGWIQYV